MIDITTVNSSWLQSASVYECSKDTTTREIKRAKTKFLRLRSFQSIEYTATIIHPYSFFLLSSRSSLRHNLVLVFSYTSFVCYWKRVPLLLSWAKSEYFFFWKSSSILLARESNKSRVPFHHISAKTSSWYNWKQLSYPSEITDYKLVSLISVFCLLR